MSKTVTCPNGHNMLAKVSCGKPYGHVPGHQYHDVAVLVSQKGDVFRVQVVETWGSCQGYDEENGRNAVIGRGDRIADAIKNARTSAQLAGIDTPYLEQALTQAEDEAEDEADVE